MGDVCRLHQLVPRSRNVIYIYIDIHGGVYFVYVVRILSYWDATATFLFWNLVISVFLSIPPPKPNFEKRSDAGQLSSAE